jgi:predicted nuclease of predicted toxin-antitoxin system
VKFLVDMALSPDLAIWLRSQGHDAVHASELALNRAPDTQILLTALDGGRVVSRPTSISPGSSRWLERAARV